MSSFSNALKSEWTKMSSLTSTWVFAITLIGALIGPLFLILLTEVQRSYFGFEFITFGGPIFLLIALIYAGATLAGEYADSMHAHAFLTQNRRSLWLSARMVLTLLFFLITAFVGTVLGYLLIVGFPGSSFEVSAVNELIEFVLTVVVFAVFAMSLGVITRSRIAAITIPLVWLIVLSGLIQALAGTSKFFKAVWLIEPTARLSQLARQLLGESPVEPYPLAEFAVFGTQPIWHNALVLLAWLILAIVVAHLVNDKRDVK